MAEYHQGEHWHILVEDAAANASLKNRRLHYCARLERLSLAHRALAAIRMAEDNAAEAIKHMKSVVGLRARIVSTMAQLALDRPKALEEGDDKPMEATSQQLAESTGGQKGAAAADPSSPFVVAPLPPDKTGANEPSKDEQAAAKTHSTTPPMANKYLHGIQWTSADVSLPASRAQCV